MKYLINLFPEKEKNASDKIIYFAFHYLRYILVITQFVAICVFFYRFKVDQEIVDLKDKLSQRQSIVESTSELVNRVQEIDAKMKQVQLVLDEQKNFQVQYTYTLSQIPQEILIENFQMTADSIDIDGTADTVDPIKKMYDGLQADNKYNIIDLSTIEKGENRFSFSLHLAEFKP